MTRLTCCLGPFSSSLWTLPSIVVIALVMLVLVIIGCQFNSVVVVIFIMLVAIIVVVCQCYRSWVVVVDGGASDGMVELMVVMVTW